jgi:hypothetical protein
MSENKSVQPPTREQIAEAIAESWSNHGYDSGRIADAVLALFQQPTPSAEPEESGVCYCGTALESHAIEEHNYVDMGFPPAEPVRIADMAPGTRFRDSDGAWWTIRRTEDGDTWANGDDGDAWDLLDFDPSTVRDVTPPPA